MIIRDLHTTVFRKGEFNKYPQYLHYGTEIVSCGRNNNNNNNNNNNKTIPFEM